MNEDDVSFFLEEAGKLLTIIRYSSTQDSLEISLEESIVRDEIFNRLNDLAASRGYTLFTAGPENAQIFFVKARKQDSRHFRIKLVAFLLTLASIIFAGYQYVSAYYSEGGIFPDLFLATMYFAVPMLFFIGFREFGRFIASARYERKYELPVMIPNPILLGFAGSVSTQGSAFRNGREMLEQGGLPILMGYVASFLLVSLGTIISLPYHASPSVATPEYLRLGNPLLFSPVLEAVVPANGVFSPIEFAGWAGVIISAIDSLPLGNLDGGLVWRAVAGSRLRSYQLLITIGLVLVGLFLTFLIILPVAVLITGYQSPEPLNSRSPIPLNKKAIFAVIVLAAILTLVPVPTHQYLDSMKVSAISTSSVSIMGIDSSSTFEISVLNTGNHSFTPGFAVSPTVPFAVSSAGKALSPGQDHLYNITLFPGSINSTGLHSYVITAYSGVVKSSVNVSIQYVKTSLNLTINGSFGEYSVIIGQNEAFPVVLANHGPVTQNVSMYLFSVSHVAYSVKVNTTIYGNTTLAGNGFLMLNQMRLPHGSSIELWFEFYTPFQSASIAFITPGYDAVILNVYHP